MTRVLAYLQRLKTCIGMALCKAQFRAAKQDQRAAKETLLNIVHRIDATVEEQQAGRWTQRAYAPGWMAWMIWCIAAVFYLTGFYHRVSPAVMTDELMRAFQIGARSLGNLSAFYFYAYVLMQIPTGILIDVWGPRRLLIGGSLMAAVGAFLFGASTIFWVACVGRAIIGAATAVGWVALLKLTTHWFPSRKFAMLSGLGLLFGNVGALVAQVPLRISISSILVGDRWCS